MRTLLLTLLCVASLAADAGAQTQPRDSNRQPSPPPQPSRAGASPRAHSPIMGDVSIGERAPDFVLDSSDGRTTKLSKLRGGWVMLVFADRLRGAMPLDSIETEAKHLGARVVAVVHEKQQVLVAASTRVPTGILKLADATGEVSAMYGCYDGGQDETEPAFFLLDRDGVVRLAVLGHTFPPDEMLDLLRLATGSWE